MKLILTIFVNETAPQLAIPLIKLKVFFLGGFLGQGICEWDGTWLSYQTWVRQTMVLFQVPPCSWSVFAETDSASERGWSKWRTNLPKPCRIQTPEESQLQIAISTQMPLIARRESYSWTFAGNIFWLSLLLQISRRYHWRSTQNPSDLAHFPKRESASLVSCARNSWLLSLTQPNFTVNFWRNFGDVESTAPSFLFLISPERFREIA